MDWNSLCRKWPEIGGAPASRGGLTPVTDEKKDGQHAQQPHQAKNKEHGQHSRSKQDEEVNMDIQMYDKWQLHLARNDRQNQIQHLHAPELTRPVVYPTQQTPHRPRTSLEQQRLEAAKMKERVSPRKQKVGLGEMAKGSALSGFQSPGGSRRVSLLEQSAATGKGIRRESLAKQHLYETLSASPRH